MKLQVRYVSDGKTGKPTKMNRLLLKENHTSVNLYEKLCLLSEEQVTALDRGLDWTVQNIPDAVLVGGTAVVYYLSGDRELTPDLDFLVHHLDSVTAKLSENNTKYKPLYVGSEDDPGITVEKYNTDYLDDMKGNTELNALILGNPEDAIIGSYKINIIQPELLAIMKLNLGRERDLDDSFALLGSGKCDPKKFRSYISGLKNSLDDYDSLVQYEKLIIN
ncbi:MAG: hypothetical protein R6V04_09530 [bacterium]